MKKAILFILSIAFIVTSSCKKDDIVDGEWQEPIEQDTPYTKRVTFKTSDDVEVTADVYHVNNDYPVIILCHQEDWSRGEYLYIAPLFNELGYNCMAIDQRSGENTNQVVNRTAWFYKAKAKGIPEDYVDAEKDVIAAVDYAHKLWGKNVMLLGSGYSSGLVLKIAKENNKVNVVLAFSPGEYYSPLLNLKSAITGLHKPTFITSSNMEAAIAKEIFDVIPTSYKVQFVPTGPGFHGARVLTPTYSGSKEYWVAVKDFLGK